MLAKILSQRHGFKTTVLFSARPRRHDQSEERRLALRSGRARLRRRDRHAAAVPPLVGRGHGAVREAAATPACQSSRCAPARTRSTASRRAAAGRSWNYNNQGGFGKRVLGETWLTHWGRHKVEATRGAIEDAQRAHPVLRGVTGPVRRHRRLRSLSAGRRDHPGARRGAEGARRRTRRRPTTASARATDKQEQGVNDPAMPVVWTRVVQERRRHHQPDPDLDAGVGHGSRERGTPPADGERRVLGARPRRARARGRGLRRRIQAVLLRVRRLPQRTPAVAISSSASACRASRCRVRSSRRVPRRCVEREEGRPPSPRLRRAGAGAGRPGKGQERRRQRQPTSRSSRLLPTCGSGSRRTTRPPTELGSASTRRAPASRASPGRSRWTKRCASAGSTASARAIDATSYKIRFTPRRRGSIWSAVNIARVAVLEQEQRMQPAGLRRSRTGGKTVRASTRMNSAPSTSRSRTSAP